MAGDRFVWTPGNVSHTRIPPMVIRSYIEQREVTGILGELGGLRSACEVGAGYGRMTAVLRDNALRVVAYEREPGLVKIGRGLLPDIEFVKVGKLTQLPAQDGEFDFAMTFTVLQHMSHKDVAKVVAEIKRITSRYVLIVEDTDPGHEYVDRSDRTHFTLGRSVMEYRRLMQPWTISKVVRREMEPGFGYQGKPRPFVGHYMLFEAPA